MNAPIYCPWCGAEMADHKGRRCPEMSNILVDSFRAATRAERAARIQEQTGLALHDATRAFKVDNTGATPILPTNFDRGLAFVRNTDAAAVYVGTDERNLADPLKRFTLPPGAMVVVTTPGDLYAIGSGAAAQIVETMELPPGQYPPFAAISAMVGTGTGLPGVMRLQDGLTGALATVQTTAFGNGLAAIPMAAGYGAVGASANASAGPVASLVAKVSPGRLFRVKASNGNVAVRFLQIFDANALPADATVPLISIPMAIGGAADADFGIYGRNFATGIVVCNSSTQMTKTIGAADSLIDAQLV